MSHGKHRFLEEARKSVTLNVVGVCLNRIGTGITSDRHGITDG